MFYCWVKKCVLVRVSQPHPFRIPKRARAAAATAVRITHRGVNSGDFGKEERLIKGFLPKTCDSATPCAEKQEYGKHHTFDTKNLKDRYRVPYQLVRELFDCVH